MKYQTDFPKKIFESIESFPQMNIKNSEKYYYSFSEETSLIPNFISKRTNRGRKRKIKMPENLPKCEVCLELLINSKESLISCSICNCLFHKSCYNQYEEIKCCDKINNDISLYICIRCINAIKLKKPMKDFKCFICNQSNKVLKYNKIQNIYYHQICLDLLPELNDLKDEEICKDKIRRWRYKNSCKYCGEKLSNSTVVIKCKNTKCKQYYNIPCAIEKGLIFDLKFMKNFYNVLNNNQIPFYCYNHNKRISNDYMKYIFESINFNQKNKDEIKKFPNNKILIEEMLNYKNNIQEKEKIFKIVKLKTPKSINVNDEYFNKNEEDNNINKNSYEERKEMSIDKDEEIFNSNLDNFEVNDANFYKNNIFKLKNINDEIAFNTKLHHFYNNGGVINEKINILSFGY